MDAPTARSLQQAKLQALAGAPPWSDRQWAPEDYGPGAALRSEGDGGKDAVVFPSEPGRRSLGEALVWADRHDVGRLDLLIDAGAADAGPEGGLADALARRASWFARPDVTVHRLVTESGQKPRPEPVDPPPLTVPPGADHDHPLAEIMAEADLDHPLVQIMAGAGLEIVTEGGIVRGEVNGLEVVRVVPAVERRGDETAGLVHGFRLEVGVGQADRELTAYVHAGAEPADEVVRVRDAVRVHRRADAPRHPLNQLVPERWLRQAVTNHPERVGLAGLQPVRHVPARVGMTETAVAGAEGTSVDGGHPVVAVFSVGMDIDFVPAAAEMLAYTMAGEPARDRSAGTDGKPALWLVVPERDAHPVTCRLAAALETPAEVVPVPDDWRSW